MTRTTARLSARARGWSAIVRGFTRVVEVFPWTPLGLLIAAGTALALRYLAFEQLDLVLLVVGYACVGLLLLSTLLVVVTASVLALTRTQPMTEVAMAETMSAQATGYSLPTLRFVPLVQLEWSWIAPTVEVELTPHRGRLVEHARFVERGQVRSILRRVVVQDAFGLCRIALRKRQAALFDVLPHVGALRGLPTLTSLAGGDELSHPRGLDVGDRIELSRYVPGDPARFIHWKIFARTGKLMVRRPERALSPSRRAAAFLIAAEHDEASSAAARVAIEQRMLGRDWILGADIDTAGATDPSGAMELIVRSAAARNAAGEGAAAFFERAQRQGPVNAIVFAPPTAGRWLQVIETLARARRLHVVIGVDGARPHAEPSWWRRLWLTSDAAPEVTMAELDAVVAKLSALGCSVTVVDRMAGVVLGERHLAGMRELSRTPLQGAA